MTTIQDAPGAAAGQFRTGTLRGAEEFFRVGQDAAGFWWLLDPAGHRVVLRAVQGPDAAMERPDGGDAPAPAALLRRLGFNGIVAPPEGGPQDDGMPHLRNVDFCSAGPLVAGTGVRLPDVFAPDWPRLSMAHALAVCSRHGKARGLLGWVSDDAPGWGQPGKLARPTLLQVCLSLEPGLATYHAAWEFVLALHGGDLAAVGRAWGVQLRNKEMVRELVRADIGLASRGYARDEARWTHELARRYFTSTAAAIRAADPNHLVFGCRFGGPVGAHVLAECVYPSVDVALPDASELPAAAAGPVVAANFGWPEEAAATAGSARRLTTFERMLRRGRGALERIARHPAAVGYVWSQWQDAPGVEPPFGRGLLHASGAEAREHTELLALFNARADALRRGAAGNPLT